MESIAGKRTAGVDGSSRRVRYGKSDEKSPFKKWNRIMSGIPSESDNPDVPNIRDSDFESVVVHHLEDANFGIVDILAGEGNANVLKAIRELKQQISALHHLVESRLPVAEEAKVPLDPSNQVPPEEMIDD
jgi:hypothetical protein